MIEAHCLTLKSDLKRLEHVSKQAALWGSAGFFVREAIDGRLQTVPPLHPQPLGWNTEEARAKATHVGLLNEVMNDPGRACTRGHVEFALEWLQRVESHEVSEEDYVLMLEDDFEWNDLPGFKRFLESLATTEFDLLLVGYRGGESRHFKADWHRWWHTALSRREADEVEAARLLLEAQRWPGRQRGKYGLRKAGHHWGTHGYLMNARAARAMVQVGSSLAYPADFMTRMIQAFDLARVGITPVKWVVTRPALGSNIRSESEFQKAAQHLPSH